MFDTMYELNGVGLAAPQIRIVRRIVVIDDYNGAKYALINPYIVTKSENRSQRKDVSVFRILRLCKKTV